jgi:hypothetical protein
MASLSYPQRQSEISIKTSARGRDRLPLALFPYSDFRIPVSPKGFPVC